MSPSRGCCFFFLLLVACGSSQDVRPRPIQVRLSFRERTEGLYQELQAAVGRSGGNLRGYVPPGGYLVFLPNLEALERVKQEVTAVSSVTVLEGGENDGPQWVDLYDSETHNLQEAASGPEESLQGQKRVINKLGTKLGSGSYGNVYVAEVEGLASVAAKFLDEEMLRKEGDLEQSLADFYQEVEVHQTLQHPNIVRCFGLAELAAAKAAAVGIGGGRGPAVAMLAELMDPAKTLTKVLRKRTPLVTKGWRIQCALDIARALGHIHSLGIVYYDLKGDNVMIGNDTSCKLNDFGLALRTNFEASNYHGRGSIAYMAPEMIDHDKFVDEKVDVYSFGILMWELMAGQEPHEELSYKQIEDAVLKKGLRPQFVVFLEEQTWVKLMEECWQEEPSLRPSFSTVLQRLGGMQHLGDMSSSLDVNHI